MKILVVNRDMVGQINPPHPYIVISVTDPAREWAVVYRNENCRGVLALHFHDADAGVKYAPAHLGVDEASQHKGDLILCDENLARTMINFVHKHRDASLLICQCDAGISRSSGIAAAFGKILNGDDTFIFENPLYKPNRTVYRTILETYFSSPELAL